MKCYAPSPNKNTTKKFWKYFNFKIQIYSKIKQNSFVFQKLITKHNKDPFSTRQLEPLLKVGVKLFQLIKQHLK